MEHRRAMGRDGGVHSHLHDGQHPREDPRMVAGAVSHFSRQSDRSHPDDVERASGNSLRHPLPRVASGELRHPWSQCRGAAARCRGLWMVRHPDMARRGGAPRDAGDYFRFRYDKGSSHCRPRYHHGATRLFPGVLGHERVFHLEGHGVDQMAGGIERSFPSAGRLASDDLGRDQGGRLGTGLLGIDSAGPCQLGRLRGRPNSDGRVLVHPLP